MLSVRLLLFFILFYCEFYSAFSGLRQEPIACCMMNCSSLQCDETMDPADCAKGCARVMGCTVLCCIYLLPEGFSLDAIGSSDIAWISPDCGKAIVNMDDFFRPPESNLDSGIHV